MTILSNHPVHVSASAEQLAGYVRSANEAFKNYKNTAMTSTAYCYLIWWHAASEQADQLLREWLEQQIRDRNVEVDHYNDDLASLKKRVADYNSGKDTDLSDKELGELKPYLGYTDEDWTAEVKMKVEARNGSSPFTGVVKYTFCFDSSTDASNVSRYCKALEYVNEHHGQLTEVTVDAVVKLLETCGGFEAAVDHMRGHIDESASQTPEKPGVNRDAKVDAFKNAISNSTALFSGLYNPKFAKDDLVFLIARKRVNSVDILGELDLTENEANGLVMKVDTDCITTLDPFAEFAAQITSLSSLVHEGKDSSISVDGTAAGKKFKVVRSFTLCDDKSGRTQVQVSARYAEASVVVHALPKSDMDIGTPKPGQFLMLPTEPVEGIKIGKDMAKSLADIGDRVMLKFESAVEDSETPIIWNALSGGHAGFIPVAAYKWGVMATQRHFPVSVYRFNARFEVTLSMADMLRIRDSYTSKWERAPKNAKKVFLPLELSCNGVDLALDHQKYHRITLAVGTKASANVTLLLRPRDLSDLVDKLCEQKTQSFAIKGDPDGLLAVEWSDKYGDYSVHMPTVNSKGALETRCLGHLAPAL